VRKYHPANDFRTKKNGGQGLHQDLKDYNGSNTRAQRLFGSGGICENTAEACVETQGEGGGGFWDSGFSTRAGNGFKQR